MRCALVIPSWVPEDIFPTRTAASQINYWQPLGTLYVAACLRRAGHRVAFFDGAFLSHRELLAALRRFDPGWVGIYATAFGWPQAKRTAADVKALLGREVFVCGGGPHPSALGARALAEPDAAGFDALVVGEGEITVPELVARLEGDGNLAGVRGLVWRRGEEVVTNPPRPFITDLDSLPFPARDLLGDRDRYVPPAGTYRRRPVAVVLTSRGCNRRCIYCFQLDRERRAGIRYRSVENVLAEMEHLLASGYREIKFIDDTLAADYDRALELARAIRARRLRCTWFASACANQVDKALLRAFKDAGCWAILFGAESGVQRNLNAIRKGVKVEQIRQAVRWAKEVGLKPITPFIFGIPGQTYEDALETIRFALELDPYLANFHALVPFPGTELYDHAERWGTIAPDLRDYTYQGAAFVPYTLTRDQIRELRALAFRRFYGRPRYILRRLLEMRNLNDLRAAWRGARSLLALLLRRDALRVSRPAAPAPTPPAAPPRSLSPAPAATPGTATPAPGLDRRAG